MKNFGNERPCFHATSHLKIEAKVTHVVATKGGYPLSD